MPADAAKFRTFPENAQKAGPSEPSPPIKPPPAKPGSTKPKKKNSAQKHEWYAPMAVLVVSVLLAFGVGRYVRTSIHYWVDRSIQSVLSVTTTIDDNDASENDSKDSSTKIWTITPDSTGLKADAEIYNQFLGAEVSMLEDNSPASSDASCVHIFLEVTPKTPNADMHSDWDLTAAPSQNPCRVMIMANTDQFIPEVFDVPNLELILCKTRQCVSWVQDKREARETKIPILYTGFTSRPPSVPAEIEEESDNAEERFQRFLHVAGQSPHKGTWNILQAWIQHPNWPPLTITSYKNQMLDTLLKQMFEQLNIQQLPPNIQHINKKLPREELDLLMYNHGVHLCLSGMEGFGHYLNEARAIGALILASNYPAMNELITEEDGGILLEPTDMLKWTNGLSFANVGAPEVTRVVNEVVLPMSSEEKKIRGNKAKEAFYRDREVFEQRMRKFQCYIEVCSNRTKQMTCAKDECGLVLE